MTTTGATDQVLDLLERTGELRTANEIGHDTGIGFTTSEDIVSFTTADVTTNDSDVEDPSIDPTTISIVSGPANGSLINNGDGTFDYSPDPDFYGPDPFTYTITDTEGLDSTHKRHGGQVTIIGNVIVEGSNNRIRGAVVSGDLSVPGSFPGISFGRVSGVFDLSGSNAVLLGNALCGSTSVSGSGATALGNAGLTPVPASEGGC